MKTILPIILCLTLAGCAHDNGIIFKPAAKPDPAGTIHAVGDVLGGAWDRLHTTKGN